MTSRALITLVDPPLASVTTIVPRKCLRSGRNLFSPTFWCLEYKCRVRRLVQSNLAIVDQRDCSVSKHSRAETMELGIVSVR